MLGAGLSLTGRSVQLLKRVKVEREVTLVGGILRWGRIAQAISEDLKMAVNVPEDDMPQFVAALGCAILGHLRLRRPDVERGALGRMDSLAAYDGAQTESDPTNGETQPNCCPGGCAAGVGEAGAF